MNFLITIAAAAFLYTLISRVIQFKFGGQSEMMTKNKKINKLNKEYLNATKRGDDVIAKKIQEEQMKLMKGMWSSVITKMWVFIPILLLFFGFMYFLGAVNPYALDDIHVNTTLSPAMYVGNNTMKICEHYITNNKSDVWTAHIKGKIADKDIEKFPHFLVNTNDTSLFERAENGNEKGDFTVRAENNSYSTGEKVSLLVSSKNINKDTKGNVECSFDNGTYFYYNLGFTIPILHIRYITSYYWMFILLSIIFGFAISKFFNDGKSGKKGKDVKGNNNEKNEVNELNNKATNIMDVKDVKK